MKLFGIKKRNNIDIEKRLNPQYLIPQVNNEQYGIIIEALIEKISNGGKDGSDTTKYMSLLSKIKEESKQV